jgi:sulfate transport system permease protein
MVTLPLLLPTMLTGFGLSFARALGEYGSIVFISGNIPFQTEIAPTLIVMRLDQYDYSGAIAVALVLMIFSFALLLTLNTLQGWADKFQEP